MDSNDSTSSIFIKIPFSTIMTVLLTLFLVRFVEAIVPIILPLFISILVAVSLYPIFIWMQKNGLPKWLSVMLLTLSLAGGVILVVATIAPQVYAEGSAFIQNLPHLRAEMLNNLSYDNPLRSFIEQNLTAENLSFRKSDLKQVIGAGNMVLGGVTECLLIFVFVIYLISDGERVIEWLSAFFSPITQDKIAKTCSEVSKIISAYVVGQFITSVLSFLLVLGTLSILGIPNILLLATLAGLLDILPVLGFFLAVIPAMIFALNISSQMSLVVLALYLLYHALENYFIAPFVYGQRLRISSFVVFFTLIAAGLLAGIEGAIAALPIVASYPIIERIWLKRYLSKDTLEEHRG